jgi:glycine/D-amino acid oxidase-like deaminating enzyme
MSKSRPGTVAVIGGGVIGVSTAHHLARSGVSAVLVTDGELSSQASGRSLSWLNSAAVRSANYHRLRLAGIDRYRTLFAQQPEAAWLRFDGGLAWESAERAEDLQHQHQHAVAHGYESHLLGRNEVSTHVTGLNIDALPESGVVWNPGEGWVDLPSLVLFLAKDMVERGGRLVTNAGAATVRVQGGRATGVRTADGDVIDADTVVVAAGAATPALLSELGVVLPDATSTALLVATRPVQHHLRAVLNTPRASLRPTPTPGVLVVDSDWTTDHVVQEPDGRFVVPDEIVTALLAEASRLLEGTPALLSARYAAGPKPIPGDGEPVLGAVDQIPGLYVGFTHSGATLGLIAGELLAYEIVAGQAHPMLTAFNLRRSSSA